MTQTEQDDQTRRRIRIGIDTGGTFTDVVALDEVTGDLVTTKTPSTPSNPADGFINGVAKVLDLMGASGDDITAVSHGTTVATNKLLEGKVAPETLTLARQAVVSPRGRRFDRTIEAYLDIASARREQQTATVTSAVPLSDGERERLAAGLAAIYGGKVHVNTVVDPRVLGGVKVEIGDEVIDGTVIRKLDGARRAMGA